MTPNTLLEQFLQDPKNKFYPVVDFDQSGDQLLKLNLTAANTELNDEILTDTARFSNWITQKISESGARYAIGGYNEHRTIYSRSKHFDSQEEPRRLHLGTDIWAPALTPIYNFFEGTVLSFKNNDNFGDYGATIIMRYELGSSVLHALYGHLSLSSLEGLREGMKISAGQQFAWFGIEEENGYWPPHLHLQLIWDMNGYFGDYPGVCQYSKRDEYLQNCPEPALVLAHTFGEKLNIL